MLILYDQVKEQVKSLMSVKWQHSQKVGYLLGNDVCKYPIMYPEVSFLPAAYFVRITFKNFVFCMVMELQPFLIGKFFVNCCHFNVISVFIT